MKLTLEEVEHIAELARLRLSSEEKARYAEQLSDILDYAARLQSVDTTGISPTASVITTDSVLREDKVRPGLSQQELLDNAPEITRGQFRVPPVLE
ncbi:MAG TPA: Asp-tRNA(Asn)/Glu-tRNA(Gln) amidotransferase subunit GatC [Anaerolineales bacterium]|nr:Asp-tRNA(Asn)/Glu-tRNA(Gln) amidotransferase subunit GatC [Anaerolineales bacterium]